MIAGTFPRGACETRASCHNDGMAVRITIRNVPDEVRDELLRDIRAAKAGTRIEPEAILQARDADRR